MRCRQLTRFDEAVSSVALAVLLAACAADPVASNQRTAPTDPNAFQGGDTIEIPTVECSADNPFCSASAPPAAQSGAPAGRQDCGDVPVDLAPAGVNIMIAVQGSPTMAMHWPQIRTAIRSLREGNPSAQFGVHVFWGEVADPFAMPAADMSNNVCGAIHNDVLEVAGHSEQELLAFLGDEPPGQWWVPDQIPISPVLEPLNYYLTNASTLADPTRTNYLVLIGDGNDNCFGSFFVGKDDKLVAYQKIGVELYKQGIRVIPIGFNAPNMMAAANPFGVQTPGTDTTATNNAVLQTLLEYGGAALPEVPKVDDPSKLASAVQQVGQRISNCRFELPAALDPNADVSPFALEFSINGQDVPRDRLDRQGWNFVDGGTSQVEMFGDACTAIQAGEVVQVKKACGTNVCGTASVKVETRPRAVLLLLDSSASRIECVDGSLGCLTDPNSTPDRPPTFWETVQHAIGATLTAPINDDVEFGMQFFPSKNAAAFSCDVEAQPEIPPAQSTEIKIMKGMLEKLPFGLSPLVAVMESVVGGPGRLADPDALGAVVMLSDGGENCASVDQAEIVSRLETAAGALLDMGIKTYAVRYGSDAGRTPEGDEQLSALVTAGGTAAVDPNDPSARPYLDATTVDELADAMANIADRLATCSFALDGLPDGDSQKDKANLYLNGEVIPFDMAAGKQDGWNWVDQERTTVELYGESCTAFKTNRRTSIVVEFGCPPVTVD